MNCLKCGQEVRDGQVFCLDCLLEMEKYPIKPGIIVQLPVRDQTPPGKRPRSRYQLPLSPEEQLAVLKRRVQTLTVALAVTLLLLAGVCFFSVHQLRSQPRFSTGQNYSAVVPTGSTG